MSDKFKNVALTRRSSGLLSPQQASDPFATKEYSEETQRYIDETIASMINERYQHVVNMLTEKKYLLDHISSVLLEKEVIEESEFAELLEGGTSIPKKLQEPMVAAEAAHLPGATEKASISSASGK